MAVNTFTFNGIKSDTYGIIINGTSTFVSAEKDYEQVSIPGKSGDLFFFNGRYKNVEIQYPIVISTNWYENDKLIKQWLYSPKGYSRLSDDYHPGEYRMAQYLGPLTVTPYLFEIGSGTVTFNCKPERYLTSGETAISFSTAGTINNPYLFSSKPLIRVFGYGQITIGSYSFTVGTHGQDYCDIDSDSMQCHYGGINLGAYVTIDEFPLLIFGNNAITIGEASRVDIYPRWWII